MNKPNENEKFLNVILDFMLDNKNTDEEACLQLESKLDEIDKE